VCFVAFDLPLFAAASVLHDAFNMSWELMMSALCVQEIMHNIAHEGLNMSWDVKDVCMMCAGDHTSCRSPRACIHW